ncbi:hypothetical protein PIB30_082667, partial [Stylosanthes scabra]|nr:hypothetical protein [Stylosanthes scabra]
VPPEIEVQPQVQPNVPELIRKGFEDMRTMMTEGFAKLSDRIDSLNIHMANQGEDLRSLRDEFRSFRGEDPLVGDPEQQDDAPSQD